MPPKRPKSGTQASPSKSGSWEQGIASTLFHEDKWNSMVAFVIGHKYEDYNNIKYLAQSIKAGYRRLFSIVSRDELFELVHEYGNPKNSKKGLGAPAYFEICEVVKPMLDNNEDIPLPILAKLIKWRLLDIKMEDVKRRDQELKELGHDPMHILGLSGSEPGTAKGAKGDKKDRGKSAGKEKKGGKKSPEVPSGKNPSKLKMRGEDDQSAKLLNDEPDDGPEHYVVVTGFHHPHLITFLSDIGVMVECVIGLSSETYSRFQPTELDKELAEKVEKDEKTLATEEEARKKRNTDRKQIAQFWRDFPLLAQSAPLSSHLHQVASLDYMLPNEIIPEKLSEDQAAQEDFGKELFETVACMMYDILDSKRHWRAFLSNLKLTRIPLGDSDIPPAATPQHTDRKVKSKVTSLQAEMAPPPGSPSRKMGDEPSSAHHVTASEHHAASLGEVDMRYYHDLMNSIPQECVSVPIVLHCMLEQVVASEEDLEPPSEVPKPIRPDGLTDDLGEFFGTVLKEMGLPSTSEETSKSQNGTPTSASPQLINYYDRTRQRLGILKSVNGFNPLTVELEMLKKHPVAMLWEKLPDVSGNALQLRAARLQELVHFVTTGGLTQAEVDRCLKQFVLESVDLTTVDEDGTVLPPPALQNDIPWDDPYPYFKGMVHLADDGKKEERKESRGMESGTGLEPVKATPYPEEKQELSTEKADTPPAPASAGSIASSKPILKRPGSRGSTGSDPNVTQSMPAYMMSDINLVKTAQPIKRLSVHFERDEEGNSLLEPGDSESDSEPDDLELDKPPNVNDPEWSITNEKLNRNLDQYCFAEHLEHDVLLQLLQQCYETHTYMDTYYHRRDHSLLVVMHNPYNSLRMNESEWTANLHSDLGFRNFMYYISGSIKDWTRDQDAQYQATLLASEVDKIKKEAEDAVSLASGAYNAKEDKGKKGKSKQASAKGGKGKESTRPETEEKPVEVNPYMRANSIKAYQEEQERLKREEEAASRLKAERQSSGKKKGEKKSPDDKKHSYKPLGDRPDSKGSRGDSARSRDEMGDAASQQPTEPEMPFKGYNMGDNIIRISGKSTNMFPADGAFISVETINFEQMGCIVKARLLKDGHCFNVHVLDPKSCREEEEEVEQEPPLVPGEDTGEQSKDSPRDGRQDDENKPPAIGRFGSMTASFCDGMSLSLSVYGSDGEPKDGAPYMPPAYELPQPLAAPSPGPADGKVSQTKSKGKRGNTPELPPEEPLAPSPIQEEPEKEPPMNRLHMTCPDGLLLDFITEGSLGMPYHGKRELCVRQSYPYPTRGDQPCEQARLKGIAVENSRLTLKDGTTIKTLREGGTQILYPDGTYTELVTNSALLLPEAKKKKVEVEPEKVAPSPKKTASRNNSRRTKKEEEQVEEEPPPPEGYWITTKPSGERTAITTDGKQVPVKQGLISKASDPATGQYMLTRDDHVVTVQHQDGTTLVEHNDGTRITTFYKDIQAPRKESANSMADETGEVSNMMETIRVTVVVVECPGFVSVRFDHDPTMCVSAEFGVGTTVQMFANGTYDVYHYQGGYLHIDEDGGAMYYPRSTDDLEVHDPSLQLRYSMRHFADVVMETVDNEGNVFNIGSSGECRMLPAPAQLDAQNDELPDYKQHAPKIFILHPDGSGMHMTRFSDIADFMIKAEEDPATAILMDSLPNHPGVVGFTVLKPWTNWPSDVWLMNYLQKDIIPPGLVSRDLTTLPAREVKKPGPKFGSTAGRGLSVGSAATSRATSNLPALKCPDNLLVRQIMQYRPITHETRSSLWEGLRLYGQFVRTKLQQLEAMVMRDPRTSEEQEGQRLLQEMAIEREPTMPLEAKGEEIDNEHVSKMYENALKPDPPIPPPTPQPKRTAADWERDRRELEEAKRNKDALRNKTVPKYFSSELGQAFLLSQSTETRKHSGSKKQQKDKESSSDGKKTQQASKAGSPFTNPTPQTMGESVSPSKIRPINPTPELATGEKSPAGVRPINPTPGHGIKMPERPTAPTPKEQDYGENRKDQKGSDQNSGKYPVIEEVPEKTPQSYADHNKAVYLNVLGKPRTGRVKLPGYLKKERVLAAPNIRNQAVEFPVRRGVLTSSVAGARAPGLMAGLQGLRPSPASVHFGTLREGGVYRCTVTLMNTGVDSCRYRVKQPPLSTGISIIYKPGPVAAGMQSQLTVEIYAVAAGVQGGSGTGVISHHLEIITETDHLFLPIMASIMTAADYDRETPGVTMTGPGIYEVDARGQGTLPGVQKFRISAQS